ncbi:MAG: hypothetical protein AB8B72_04030 [Crocinitomicaceae bacterium]
MRLSILLLILLTSISALSQNSCSMVDQYEKIFTAKLQTFNEKTFVTKRVNKLKEGECYAKFVNENEWYIDYLKGNFSSYKKDTILLEIKDSTELQKQFISNLKKDTTFNSILKKVEEKINKPKTFVSDTISLDQLMNYAVKFFLITGINENGHYLGQVCGGHNGLRFTNETRNPHVEAFCFATIFENYDGKLYSMQAELINGIKEVIKVKLGTNIDDRLLRAQGALFLVMKNNKTLKKLLLKTYKKKREYLPFVILK